MTFSEEVFESVRTTATDVANSSILTWEDTNKSSWTDYVAANSSNSELNSTATYQTESEWNMARSQTYSNLYDTAFETAWKDIYPDAEFNYIENENS